MSTVSVTDSRLLGQLFASADMARMFDDTARLKGMLDFEGALARAEAALDLIPHDAAATISECCKPELFDLDELGAATALAGNPAIPLVKALTAKVEGDAARYVHWGGTSQDVIDTGLALQMRDGLRQLRARVTTLGEAVAGITEVHRATPAIGRTLQQHAAPIPFGLRTAGWLGALADGLSRLDRLQDECIRLSFFGAFGSLASLGKDGMRVADRLSDELGLKQATLANHSHRGHMADIASGLAILCGSCAKIARDVQLMMQTDIGETFEPAAPGKGGSSTMPHKRNPVATTVVLANYRQVSAASGLLLSGLDHAFERDAGHWHAEWGPIAEIFVLTAGSVEALTDALCGLEVDTARMAQNVETTHGLVFAEAVMMVLAPVMGRLDAHHLVQTACRDAVRQQTHLRDVLLYDGPMVEKVGRKAIVDAFDPVGYFGAADSFIDRALAAWTEANTP